MEEIKKVFLQKYNKNSSINSLIRVIHSTPELNQFFGVTLNNPNFFNLLQNNSLIFMIKNGIDYLNRINQLDWSLLLNNVRTIFSSLDSSFQTFEEYNFNDFLLYFLNKMHKDLNIISGVQNPFNPTSDQALQTYFNNRTTFINFIFANNFYGTIKTELICKQCGYYQWLYEVM